jgi:peptidyl-prolyl cis-trans isomerase A (cyclophilin A)
LPPIAHETTRQTGLRHLDGTVSMARAQPGTANSEFFVCVGDQPALDFGGGRQPDGQGFAAFGRVVEGMDVIAPCTRAARPTNTWRSRSASSPVRRVGRDGRPGG